MDCCGSVWAGCSCINTFHENKELLIKNASVCKFTPLSLTSQLFSFLIVNHYSTIPPEIGHATLLIVFILRCMDGLVANQ